MSLCALLAQPIPFVLESSSTPKFWTIHDSERQPHPFTSTDRPLTTPPTLTSSTSYRNHIPCIPSSTSSPTKFNDTLFAPQSISPSQPSKRKYLSGEPSDNDLNHLSKRQKLSKILRISKEKRPTDHITRKCKSGDSEGQNINYQQTKPPDKSPILVRARGYLNKSGTHCYRNASLQALGSVFEFRTLVLNHICGTPKHCIYCHLRIVFNEHYKINGTRLPPHEPSQLRTISQFIGGAFARTRFSQQEDAHEYIALLLDRLSTRSKKFTSNNMTALNDIFMSTKITKILCTNRNCSNLLSARSMEDTLIMLNIPKSSTKYQELSLDDCLAQYTKTEHVADYKCEKCGKLGIKKRLLFEAPPRVALIALSRFKFGWSEGRVKDKRKVTFPEYLTWGSYTLKPSGRSRLSAVICHESSTLDSGHYFAIVHAGGGIWLKYDDDQVARVKSPLEGLQQKWYMLLYEYQED
ncbi:hypothetical protein ABW20_dc0100477 [Dactylellina cionopaga]|nr:hypothetical protein ABW20_dc0100477 [Dactylellina cionopaga]